ncbi:MAG TPA: hypothetical protein ENK05_07810 [Gammaproteobacteria bacterium]|nr:hypothetical protein [Gammaproteobacteria bacterium]
MRYHKPDLLLLVVLFVAVGVLASSLARADDSIARGNGSRHDGWSSWHLDIAMKLRSWKSSLNVQMDARDGGVNLARPFGSSGPQLRISTSGPKNPGLKPVPVRRSSELSVSDLPVFLFLEKRW